MKKILVLLVVLASCTPSYSTFLKHPERWTKPNYDFQHDFERFVNDEFICRQKAESLTSISPLVRTLESAGLTPPIVTGMDIRKKRDTYKQCMESMGYVWK
jgi:hypothetical protein